MLPGSYTVYRTMQYLCTPGGLSMCGWSVVVRGGWALLTCNTCNET